MKTEPAAGGFLCLAKKGLICAVARQAGATASNSPTADKTIALLCRMNILREITGKRHDRVCAYRDYLDVPAEDATISRR